MVRTAAGIAIYIIMAWLALAGFGWLFLSATDNPILAATVTSLLAALLVNWLCGRIYEGRGLTELGLGLSRASLRNALLGLAGGAGAAVLVLLPPLLTGAASLRWAPENEWTPGMSLFTAILLLIGSAGEEILMRGYAFQVLLRSVGAWATIVPVGVLFALMHAGNPAASPLGLANTAGFGVLFGYAFLRSRDIWLPIGLHFGWNLLLPLFGVNVSGLKIGMTGYAMQWNAGTLWSGGAYGPEGSLLTSAAMAALACFLWRAPITRQPAPLLDATPAEV